MDEKNSGSRPIEREIRCTLATLRVNSQTGWKRLVTVTRWGGQAGRFKLDIRDWSEDMSRSTKGLTMNRAEVEKLRNILTIMDMSLIDEGYTDVQSGPAVQQTKTTRQGSNRYRSVPAQPVSQEAVPEVEFAGTSAPVAAAHSVPEQEYHEKNTADIDAEAV